MLNKRGGARKWKNWFYDLEIRRKDATNCFGRRRLPRPKPPTTTMNARIVRIGSLAVCLLGLAAQVSSAAPGMGGPLPDEQREIIREMAARHQELKREVVLTDDGYTATTTTENKELAAKLKAHLAYMEKRLESKAMVRRWDPAFVELVDYYDQLDTEIRPLENGVKVTVKGKSAEAIKVAQNHAGIVSGFAKEGPAAVQREHPAVVPRKKEKKAGTE
jgi:hypothetical protein